MSLSVTIPYVHRRPSPKGGWEIVSMRRRLMFSPSTFEIISDKSTRTGVRAWVPQDCFKDAKVYLV